MASLTTTLTIVLLLVLVPALHARYVTIPTAARVFGASCGYEDGVVATQALVSGGGSTQTTLGEVTVAFSGDNLVVTYSTTSGTFTDAFHVQVSSQPVDRPVPGRFPCKAQATGGTQTLTCPLSDFPVDSCCDTLYIYTHGVVDGETVFAGERACTAPRTRWCNEIRVDPPCGCGCDAAAGKCIAKIECACDPGKLVCPVDEPTQCTQKEKCPCTPFEELCPADIPTKCGTQKIKCACDDKEVCPADEPTQCTQKESCPCTPFEKLCPADIPTKCGTQKVKCGCEDKEVCPADEPTMCTQKIKCACDDKEVCPADEPTQCTQKESCPCSPMEKLCPADIPTKCGTQKVKCACDDKEVCPADEATKCTQKIKCDCDDKSVCPADEPTKCTQKETCPCSPMEKLCPADIPTGCGTQKEPCKCTPTQLECPADQSKCPATTCPSGKKVCPEDPCSCCPIAVTCPDGQQSTLHGGDGSVCCKLCQKAVNGVCEELPAGTCDACKDAGGVDVCNKINQNWKCCPGSSECMKGGLDLGGTNEFTCAPACGDTSNCYDDVCWVGFKVTGGPKSVVDPIPKCVFPE